MGDDRENEKDHERHVGDRRHPLAPEGLGAAMRWSYAAGFGEWRGHGYAPPLSQYPAIHSTSVSTVEPMMVPQAKISMLTLSRPRPVSQIRWRIPPSMWWIRPQLNTNSRKRPKMLPKKSLTVA